MNKKGFSVLELILVLIVSMAVSVLTISNGKSLNMEHYYLEKRVILIILYIRMIRITDFMLILRFLQKL